MSSLQEIIHIVQEEARAQEENVPGAHLRLLEATEKLRHKVESPGDALARFRFQFEQNLCIRIIIENGTLASICSKNRAPVTTDELARLTGAEELLTRRMLRLLASVGFLDEVAERTFAANDVTDFANTPGMTGGLRHAFDMHTNVGSKIIEQMHTGGGVRSFPEPPNESGPWAYAFGGKSFWETLERDSGRKRDFDAYMAQRNQSGAMPQWWEVYPAGAQLPKSALHHENPSDAVTLVDVGGNRGHDIANFKKLYPEIPGRFILEELPKTIEEIKKSAAESQNVKEIELLPYDFFTPQPVKGARAYFFGNILHDWSDKRCQQLLSNTVAAMDKDHSRILIDDFVLPAKGCMTRPASMDMHMMFCLSGIERTEPQWVLLLESVGLEIVKIWSVGAPGMSEAIIEARRRE